MHSFPYFSNLLGLERISVRVEWTRANKSTFLLSLSMPPTEQTTPDAICALRKEFYNATVTTISPVHDDLWILRVVTDGPLPVFQPGQYVALGLGEWEPRVAGVDAEHLDPHGRHHLIKRAYSIACSLLDREGKLVRANHCPYLEFYISLVRHGATRPPALTPRLFLLQEGDRLFVEEKAKGNYTLEGVCEDDDVLFLATGTGEAPHNAMLAELLARSHRGHIVSAVCVRVRQEAAYRQVNEELARKHSNYQYFAMTTREPENLDPRHPQFVGKRYLQDFVASGDLERQTEMSLRPERTHVFLCGNPDMIGVQRGAIVPGAMADLLASRGFRLDHPHAPGNLHVEHYW